MGEDRKRWGRGRKLAVFACLGAVLALSPTSFAAEGWKAEFEEVCSKADTLDSLTAADISALLARCDKLGATLEAANETERKINQRRLKNCCDLIRFMLESKQAEQAKPAQ